MVTIAFSADRQNQWLRCLTCSSAYVINGGAISPSSKPLSVPLGVGGVELEAWNEVRDCLGVAAYTAAVMMCRKLLFHIAVANGLPDVDSKGYAPTFSEAVEFIITSGLASERMRSWVERIKTVGNEANHKIIATTKEVAEDIAAFTEQLLKLTYEMDIIMKQQDAARNATQAD